MVLKKVVMKKNENEIKLKTPHFIVCGECHIDQQAIGQKHYVVDTINTKVLCL